MRSGISVLCFELHITRLAHVVEPMEKVEILYTSEPEARDLPPPEAATPDAAGADLRAALTEPITIEPGRFTLVNTGLRIQLPHGYEAQVRPRSGLAAKHGITCLNTPGTIDADYRGVVKVILINLGQEPFTINHGDRIAQLIIAPVTRGIFKCTNELSDSERGDGGFGHTGVQ